jgi:hypothetical protein
MARLRRKLRDALAYVAVRAGNLCGGPREL